MRTFKIQCVALLVALVSLSACSADDSNNQPPTVNLDVGNEVTVVVGETLNIVVRASDPEGGSVSFDFQARPDGQFSMDRADFLTSADQALFQWSPIASDVTDNDPMRLIFIVEDSAGNSTEKTVNVTVVPGNGVPRFLNSSSELYDPRVGKPITIDVRVRDDDSNEVALSIDESSAPPGSEFDQIGPFEGIYTWQPSVEQLRSRVHNVKFLADDAQNPVVEYVVTIVIRSRSGGELRADSLDLSCPGEEVIRHSPLLAQKTFDPYIISASLSAEAAGTYDSMFVYWTIGNPYGGEECNRATGEGDCFESIELTSTDGTNFRGAIGNQVSEGNVSTVHYQICAIDDEGRGADAVVCAPSAGQFELYHSFAVLSPDDGEACVDDFFDAGEGSDNTFAQAQGVTDGDFLFARTCQDDADYRSLRVRPGEKFLFAAMYPMGADIEVRAFDSSEQEIEIRKSECTGLSGLEVSVPEGSGEETFYLEIIGGDDLSYQVTALKTEGGEGGCIDDALEPNDTALDATPVDDGTQIDAEICFDGDSDLYAIDLNAGDVLSVTNQFTNAAGNLDMELFAPSQADIAGRDGVNSGVEFTFSTDDEEVLTHEAEETGTYYLLVFNNEPTSNAYRIEFSVEDAPPCTDDDGPSSENGGNHTQGDAWIIPQPTGGDVVELENLTICPGLPDWYQRNEFEGQPVLGTLEVTAGDVNAVTLEVFNLAGTMLDSGTLNDGLYDFDYTPSTSGPIFIKVSSTENLDYRMVLLR